MDSPSAFWNSIMHINVNRRPRGRHFVPRSLVLKSVLIPFACSSGCSTNSWSHRYFPRICLMAPTSGPVCQTPSPVVVYFQCECTRSCREKFHAVLDEQTIGYPTAGWIPLTLGGAQTCCLLGSRCEVHCNTIDKVDGTWCAFPKGTLPILVCVNFYWCSTKFCISTSHGLKIYLFRGFLVSAAAMLWARQSSTLQSLTMLSTMRL